MESSFSKDNLKEKLSSVLHEAAQKLNLRKFSILLNVNEIKGLGFLSEIYKSSLVDEESQTKIDVVIKKAPKSEKKRIETCLDLGYKNEIFFYSTVLSAFKMFQQNRKVDIFNNVPKYIISDDKLFDEFIVLEDLSQHGFELKEKDSTFDDEHIKFVFEIYGRFHAISFCIRDQKEDEYNKLVKTFTNSAYSQLTKKHGFSNGITGAAKLGFERLDLTEDFDVREKFKKYTDNTMKIFTEVLEYQGTYSCILHGDCWSNNFMFKYDGSKLEDVKFLDFQLVWTGTPVYDLSYFLYSAGSKKSFDKLDCYLDIYYKSFAKYTKEMGSEPSKLLPRQALTEDWKKYSIFGMFMAILLIRIKLMSKEDSILIAESIGENTSKTIIDCGNVNEDVFGQKVRDILYHMYEIDAL